MIQLDQKISKMHNLDATTAIRTINTIDTSKFYGKKVLIVDDNKLNLHLQRLLLMEEEVMLHLELMLTHQVHLEEASVEADPLEEALVAVAEVTEVSNKVKKGILNTFF